MASINKGKLNKIVKKIKYLKEIKDLKLSKPERDYIHSEVKYQSAKKMREANKKKYGY